MFGSVNVNAVFCPKCQDHCPIRNSEHSWVHWVCAVCGTNVDKEREARLEFYSQGVCK
jgi:hypothetical protein